MNPLVLLDTSVLMHETYSLRKSNTVQLTQNQIDEIAYKAYKAYSSLFFIEGLPLEVDILWCGDSREYWRRQYFKDWCKSLGPDHSVNLTKKTRKFKTETQEEFQARLDSGLYTVANIGYKGNRYNAPQKTLIKQRFTRITKSLTFTGFEADDVIATAVKLFPERKIIIVTVDTDLMQLVNNNVVWCSAGGHYPVVRDVENSLVWLNAYLDKEPSFVRSKLNPNLTPQSIIDLKVLRGDSSDSLPPGTPREIIDLFNPPQQFKLWEQDGILKYFEDRIIQKDVTGYTQLEELYDLGYTLFKHTPIKLNA